LEFFSISWNWNIIERPGLVKIIDWKNNSKKKMKKEQKPEAVGVEERIRAFDSYQVSNPPKTKDKNNKGGVG
jgi:hypothetical protein